LQLSLVLLRQTAVFNPQLARGASFQGNAENVSLVRIQLPEADMIYPTVSGNRHRFAVRFQHLPGRGHSGDLQQDIAFELALAQL
jgi:cell division protein ZapD